MSAEGDRGARLHRLDGAGARGMRVAGSRPASGAEILDTDHYGLERVNRISRYLAVQSRVNKSRGPITSDGVGPPRVSKTSLGQSIAKATGRKYIRMALGGVRDEAEIRGHRRTHWLYAGKLIKNGQSEFKTTVPAR